MYFRTLTELVQKVFSHPIPHSGRSYGKNKQDEHPVPSRSSIAASRTVVREDILICAGEPFRREGSKRLVFICAKGMIP